jgi:hypothetical protein
VAALSFLLWDERARIVIRRVHEWGREIADKHFFALNAAGDPIDGVHVISGAAIAASGKMKQMRSRTVSIRLLIAAAAVTWLWLIANSARQWVGWK